MATPRKVGEVWIASKHRSPDKWFGPGIIVGVATSMQVAMDICQRRWDDSCRMLHHVSYGTSKEFTPEKLEWVQPGDNTRARWAKVNTVSFSVILQEVVD